MTLVNAAVTRLGRVASVALLIAVVGGVALVVAGFLAPMYSALWQGGRRDAVGVAWTLAGLLAAFTVLAMASIRMFVAPITAAVLVACAVHRPRSEQPRAAERSAVVG
jgi:vacuolar-type H+-ATPase subunit I/STV1